MPDLFTPVSCGRLTLPNRILMAPMTRGRAAPDGQPSSEMAKYYAARAAAGLIISEGVCIAPMARGWSGAPSLYSDAHVAGWRGVTDAVHASGGRIFAQLWHLGRVSHPVFLDGAAPWAPSAIRPAHHVHAPSGAVFDCVEPLAMSQAQIDETVAAYGTAAGRAIAAGFDGVQLHAANGYLIDQFLRTSANQRRDGYGGSAQARCRFLLEATAACCATIGADRVSVRLSPRNPYNDISDARPEETFIVAARLLAPLALAFLEVVEGLPGHFLHVPAEPLLPAIGQAFGGMVVANGGYDRISAQQVLDGGIAAAVSFGIPFLANPDLVARYRQGAPLNPPVPATFYTPGEPGYLSYPTLQQAAPSGDYRPISLADAARH